MVCKILLYNYYYIWNGRNTDVYDALRRIKTYLTNDTLRQIVGSNNMSMYISTVDSLLCRLEKRTNINNMVPPKPNIVSVQSEVFEDVLFESIKTEETTPDNQQTVNNIQCSTKIVSSNTIDTGIDHKRNIIGKNPVECARYIFKTYGRDFTMIIYRELGDQLMKNTVK